MGVVGVWQRQGEVQHFVARLIKELTNLLGRLDTESWDLRSAPEAVSVWLRTVARLGPNDAY